MRAIVRLLTCLAVLVCSAPAWACDTEADERTDSTCVVAARGGRKGVWFDLATADQLRREHEAAPVVANMLQQYRDLAALRETQVRSLERAEADRVKAAAELATALKAAKDDAVSERAARDAWYRSPWLWAGVGAALGAFVTYEVTR